MHRPKWIDFQFLEKKYIDSQKMHRFFRFSEKSIDQNGTISKSRKKCIDQNGSIFNFSGKKMHRKKWIELVKIVVKKTLLYDWEKTQKIPFFQNNTKNTAKKSYNIYSTRDSKTELAMMVYFLDIALFVSEK